MKKLIKNIFIAAVLIFAASCSEEDLNPTLAQDKDVDSSISTVDDLSAVLSGAYNRISLNDYYGRNIIIYKEVMADNAYSNANSNRFVNAAAMDFTIESADPEDTWARIYSVIASANILIAAEDIEGSSAEINHIKGQAYALRALGHFDLLKVFGQQHVNGGSESSLGVPYVTEFRDPEALFPSRNTVGEVKTNVYEDLNIAKSLMTASLNDGSSQFITTYAVDALLSRAALYFGDFAIARDAAKAVIDAGQFSILEASDFVSSFNVDSSSNSIFEIANSDVDNQGINGLANIYQDTNYGDVVVLEDLVNTYEATDVRGLNGVITQDEGGRYRNTGKYPTLASFEDNIPVIRYEEIILNYAEALLETSDAGTALTFLNMIPAKRNASAYASATKENILLERRKELAFEGFRFDDLARTGQDIPLVNSVLQTHDGPVYGSFNYAFPIPSAEVLANSNVAQNAGY
ncbi:RagB/SusD family nutrient uptake outer membrane protein [Cellulophaga baltica]|uniref:RagB/SusD family nutrient uptake outer membrane protein n=1 Tax=Cellulophaga baltica TaxID=76594 RepID=UPI002147DCDB|nr:RagB/SusD family nutrient uptake outer membrane protein [Cellulophaga baltica]MCR1025509.1 RagB/SusD family nutrient uptake outer membrane protein [Cellulophaga baltica]